MKENKKELEERTTNVRMIGLSHNPETFSIIYTDEFGCSEAVCDDIAVVGCVKNLDTQEVVVKFQLNTAECKDNFQGTLEDLARSKFYRFLSRNGVIVKEAYIPLLADFFLEEVKIYKDRVGSTYIHERVGWGKNLDYRYGFFTSKSIGAPYSSLLNRNEAEFLGSHGRKEVYDEMIRTEVIPHTSLHLPFVLAFTAPLVPLLYGKTACPVLMVNFAGKSSLGKSTSLALIASVWGRGIITNNRLAIAKTFASTQNGFEATVNNNNGLPVIFDDYESASRSTNFGQLIYTLAQGESKIRCGKDGTLKETFHWRTFIGLSGESSIFTRAGNNMGLKPRIVEFKNVKWTASKENSVHITNVVDKNYGFYGEIFISKLIQMLKSSGVSKLETLYDESEKLINERVPAKDNVSDRIQQRLALIRMTAVLVRELMDLNIDVDYITDLLVNNEKNRQVNLDIYELARESLYEYIVKNLSNFVRYDKETHTDILPSGKTFGRIYKGHKGNCVALLEDSFNNIMCQFNDRDAILEKWRDEKFLVAENGRFKKKVNINGFSTAPRCYVFVLDDRSTLYHMLDNANVVDITELEIDDLAESAVMHGTSLIEKNGTTYVPTNLIDSDKDKQRVQNPNRPSRIYLSKKEVKKPVVSKQPPVLDTKYDDSDAIEHIFEDEEPNGNSEAKND